MNLKHHATEHECYTLIQILFVLLQLCMFNICVCVHMYAWVHERGLYLVCTSVEVRGQPWMLLLSFNHKVSCPIICKTPWFLKFQDVSYHSTGILGL